MIQLKEHADNTHKLQENVDLITSLFGEVHERLRIEEHRLRKPIEEQIEKSMETIKNLYSEIIHYWKMNSWLDQQSHDQDQHSHQSNLQSDNIIIGDDPDMEQEDLFNKLSTHYQIKITKDIVGQLRNSNEHYHDNDNSNDEINQDAPIISFTTGDIKCPLTKREACFSLINELKSHIDAFQSIAYEKPIPFSDINIRKEF